MQERMLIVPVQFVFSTNTFGKYREVTYETFFRIHGNGLFYDSELGSVIRN